MSLMVTVARPALHALRRAVSIVGYDLVQLPHSTDSQSESLTATLPSLSEMNGVTPLPSRALRSFPLSDGAKARSAYEGIRAGVLRLDAAKFDFPIIDAAKRGLNSSHDRILWYLNLSRIRQYCTYLDFVDVCNVPLNGRKILDVGTAAGVLPYLVWQKYVDANVHGIDVDENYVSLAQGLFPNLDFRCGSLDELSVSSKYDVVFCTQTIEHMVSPTQMVRKLLSLVAPSLDFHGALIG